ncbi:unnamed protein product [Clonostachys byssicola]|uniref:Uncharacterized protein n=1 Tax=Clonostachys byssicola TaxID=160290 RepID=A0A9N9U2Z9_9HYPO|nr:unnamed protein product [Clonostachys byssicola]
MKLTIAIATGLTLVGRAAALNSDTDPNIGTIRPGTCDKARKVCTLQNIWKKRGFAKDKNGVRVQVWYLGTVEKKCDSSAPLQRDSGSYYHYVPRTRSQRWEVHWGVVQVWRVVQV